jgi:transposase
VARRKPKAYADHTGNVPNAERRHTVIVLYESGLSIRAVAARIGVTFQAVHRMLHRAGVPMRPRGHNVGHHSRHRK